MGVTGKLETKFQPNDRRMFGLTYSSRLLNFTPDLLGKNITSQKQAAAAMEVQNKEHHLLQGFVLGALVALTVTAIASCITRRSRRHEYEAVRPNNGCQEYQHYSRNSVKDVTSITGNKSITRQGRAAP